MRDYEAQGRLYVLGFGSVSNDRMDSSTLEMVRAGDHCDLRMSRQIAPGGGSTSTLDQYRRLVDEQVQPFLPLMATLQWYTLVLNTTCQAAGTADI